MALSNYTSIADSAAKWLNREGFSDLTDLMEDFMYLGQRRIQREVRIPPMEAKLTDIAIVDGQYPIPTPMLDVKGVTAYNGSTAWRVARGDFSDIKKERLGTNTGPRYFDTIGGNFEFGGEPSSGVSVDIVYYQELEFISTSVAENWFSAYAPETILFGALVEASTFTKHDPEITALYESKYQSALALLETQKKKAEWSGHLDMKAR
jgi:hypothetical protein